MRRLRLRNWVRAGPLKRNRNRPVIGVFTGVGLIEEIVRQLKSVGDASQQIFGLAPHCRLIRRSREYRAAGLTQQGIDQNRNAAQREPPTPQIKKVNPEVLEQISFQFLGVLPDDVDGSCQFPAALLIFSLKSWKSRIVGLDFRYSCHCASPRTILTASKSFSAKTTSTG